MKSRYWRRLPGYNRRQTSFGQVRLLFRIESLHDLPIVKGEARRPGRRCETHSCHHADRPWQTAQFRAEPVKCQNVNSEFVRISITPYQRRFDTLPEERAGPCNAVPTLARSAERKRVLRSRATVDHKRVAEDERSSQTAGQDPMTDAGAGWASEFRMVGRQIVLGNQMWTITDRQSVSVHS